MITVPHAFYLKTLCPSAGNDHFHRHIIKPVMAAGLITKAKAGGGVPWA